jgi:hypothetical protein
MTQNCEYKGRCKFYDMEWCASIDTDLCHYHKLLVMRHNQQAEYEQEQARQHELNDIGLVRLTKPLNSVCE